jgi:hypothetical protein
MGERVNRALVIVLATSSCGGLLALPDHVLDDGTSGDDGVSNGSGGRAMDAGRGDGALDGGGDAPDPDPPCDPKGLFAISHLATLGTVDEEEPPTLTDDELTIFFNRRFLAQNRVELHVATRTTMGEPFGASTPLPSPVLSGAPLGPCVTGDGARLYYSRPEAATLVDIVSAPRAQGTAYDFGTETPYPKLATAQTELCRTIAPSGALYFHRENGSGGALPLVATPQGAGFGVPQPIPGLGAQCSNCAAPVVSRDERTIFFAVTVPSSRSFMHVSRRATTSASFGPVLMVDELLGVDGASDTPGWLSVDGCRLYFSSRGRTPGAGGSDLYLLTRAK